MQHHVMVQEAGSPDAPPGSRPWAVYERNRIIAMLRDASQDALHLELARDAMVRHEGWRVLSDASGRPFRSYEAFCVAPQPFGLGYSPTLIDRIIDERKAQTVADRAANPPTLFDGPGPATAEEKAAIGNDITNRPTRRGDDPDYLTARIARDHPDVLEKMRAGEYPSVRAAALDAGIVKRTATVRVDDPRATARALARRYGPDDLRTIAAELLALADPTPPAAP